MRPDRRSTLAGVGLIAVAVALVVDLLGVRTAIESWFQVASPASGTTRAMATAIHRRAATVDSLSDAMGSDPMLSLAVLATGIGAGMLLGSTVAFLHQRRRLRRGEQDG